MSEHRNLHDPETFISEGKFVKSSVLQNPTFNKGTAFTKEEREKYGLRGLLPPQVETIEQQLNRSLRQFRELEKPLEKYIFLQALGMRNETLFYRLLLENLKEMMPIVYTPTVGEACLKFDRIYRANQGLYLNIGTDRGEVRRVLDNWPSGEPDIIVVTDGSRILGLGDLGANGMGIPIGKLSLYVAAAGFHPSRTLPVLLDVGTNNETLLQDDLYLGYRSKRIRGPEFFSFVDEFLMAVKEKWPNTLVQFEDFSNDVCFDLLDTYRDKLLCFNDDIQGTGAVVVSGWINAVKLSGKPLDEHTTVIFGAGSAAVGVTDQIVTYVSMKTGKSADEVRRTFYLVDSKGLVTTHRGDKLADHKVKYARTDITENIVSLEDVIDKVKPSCLIGLSGQGGAFSKTILEKMSTINERPIIFALSNPSKNSECTAEEAYAHTKGKAIFASGSPFDPVTYEGKVLVPGQGNNVYIFPGLGLGAVIARATKVTDTMISAASAVLASMVPEEDLADGKIYPDLSNLREISIKIACAVADQAVKEGLSKRGPADYDAIVREYIYDAEYVDNK